MLPGLHRLAVSRVAALGVALVLTGAPRLCIRQVLGSRGAHRCDCVRGGGHHECSCPACRMEAARAAGVEKLPPCHRALARAAQARGGASDLPAGPCLTGACGVPEERARQASGSDVPFLVPGAQVLVLPWALASPSVDRAVPDADGRTPETPPPRCA